MNIYFSVYQARDNNSLSDHKPKCDFFDHSSGSAKDMPDSSNTDPRAHRSSGGLSPESGFSSAIARICDKRNKPMCILSRDFASYASSRTTGNSRRHEIRVLDSSLQTHERSPEQIILSNPVNETPEHQGFWAEVVETGEPSSILANLQTTFGYPQDVIINNDARVGSVAGSPDATDPTDDSNNDRSGMGAIQLIGNQSFGVQFGGGFIVGVVIGVLGYILYRIIASLFRRRRVRARDRSSGDTRESQVDGVTEANLS
ncbi:hypothetical protein J7T55_003226 [Diaporthe amygdali]|uniref:uncharacterized protein n=1 Tax=Phomopsis amygdali TaxID=1214568 RepID=UPI0022FDE0D8|nr:uncharacterized protein J7T55_003226 [Diaporthe amygdali]KAJ0122710.1 hypothetical protein J7T55_003226 [Diaporthe amygdali]